jgi:AbrB family looped-hinge helix DNA binding protein
MARKKSQTRPHGLAEGKQSAFGSDRQFVELGAAGRLVIPAAFRAALGMKPGDKLTVRLEGNELRIYTYAEGLRRARELARKYLPDNAVDEFLAYKRREAEREWAELEDKTRDE